MTRENVEIIIPFLPKLQDLSSDAYNKKLEEIRNWFDQHGRYGNTYMWKIGKKDGVPEIIGIRVFDAELATLFKLLFEI